jgi:hypothetical protein
LEADRDMNLQIFDPWAPNYYYYYYYYIWVIIWGMMRWDTQGDQKKYNIIEGKAEGMRPYGATIMKLTLTCVMDPVIGRENQLKNPSLSYEHSARISISTISISEVLFDYGRHSACHTQSPSVLCLP